MISGVNSRLSFGKSALTSRFASLGRDVSNSSLSYTRNYCRFEYGRYEYREYPLKFRLKGPNDASNNTIDGFPIFNFHNMENIIERKNVGSGLINEFDDKIIRNEILDGSLDSSAVESLSLDFSQERFSDQFSAISSELASYIGEIKPSEGQFMRELDSLEYIVNFSLTFNVSMIYAMNNDLLITISYNYQEYIIKEDSLMETLTSMSAGILPDGIRSISDTKPDIEKIMSFRESRLLREEDLRQKKLLKAETDAKRLEVKKLKNSENEIRLEYQVKTGRPGGRDGVWLYEHPPPIDWSAFSAWSARSNPNAIQILDPRKPNGVDPFPELRMY
jgi:hypothetical protein